MFWIFVINCSYLSIVGLQNLMMVMDSENYYSTGQYTFLLASQCNMMVKKTYR